MNVQEITERIRERFIKPNTNGSANLLFRECVAVGIDNGVVVLKNSTEAITNWIDTEYRKELLECLKPYVEYRWEIPVDLYEPEHVVEMHHISDIALLTAKKIQYLNNQYEQMLERMRDCINDFDQLLRRPDLDKYIDQVEVTVNQKTIMELIESHTNIPIERWGAGKITLTGLAPAQKDQARKNRKMAIYLIHIYCGISVYEIAQLLKMASRCLAAREYNEVRDSPFRFSPYLSKIKKHIQILKKSATKGRRAKLCQL